MRRRTTTRPEPSNPTTRQTRLAQIDSQHRNLHIALLQFLSGNLGRRMGGAGHSIKHFEVAGEVAIALILIVQVKDNQTTSQPFTSRSSKSPPLPPRSPPLIAATPDATGDERRTLSVFGSDWHPLVATVIRVEREVTRNSKTGLLRHTAETAFYISNMPVAAACAADVIRAHWGIETTSNYSRDVSFAQDRSRIRTNPGVFALLRSFGFNILKANRTDTLSQDRYRAALAGIDKLGSFVAISQR